MKRVLLTLLLAVGLALPLLAMRQVGFGADAFNRAYPASANGKGSVLFSPFSFEVDCVVFAEAMDVLRRANVCETLGVLTDFEGVYQPIFAEYVNMRTNNFHFISARGFCVPEEQAALPTFAELLMRDYRAVVTRLFPSRGAEAWFRTTMEGTMEDFKIALDVSRADRYSFYDLVALQTAWAEPFPTNNTRTLPFRTNDKTTCEMSFMADVRKVDLWENKEYALLRLPLKGGADFYALLPNEGIELSTVRADFSPVEIQNLLTVTKSVSQAGVYHGPAAIVLPKFSITTRVNLNHVLTYFKIPTADLTKAAAKTMHEYVQCVRFDLAEQGLDEAPLAVKDEANQTHLTAGAKKLVFNRPFMFFIYHEPTVTLPLVGLFTGN